VSPTHVWVLLEFETPEGSWCGDEFTPASYGVYSNPGRALLILEAEMIGPERFAQITWRRFHRYGYEGVDAEGRQYLLGRDEVDGDYHGLLAWQRRYDSGAA